MTQETFQQYSIRTLTQVSEVHTHNTRFAAKLNFHRPRAKITMGPLRSLLFHQNFGKLFQQISKNCLTLPFTSTINYTFKYPILL